MKYFLLLIMTTVIVWANSVEKEEKGGKNFTLAMNYLIGYEVKEDNKKAFKFFHKAARQGSVEAKYFMGTCFDQGIGVKKQQELARYWYRQAAKGGYSKAVYKLAEVERSLHIGGVYKTSYLSYLK